MSKTRLCIINKNVPNILANISKLFADHNLNIENMVNRSRGEYAYTLIDTNDEVRPDIIAVSYTHLFHWLSLIYLRN